MVKQILTLLHVAVFLSPPLSASVTEMCVTPICRCSSHPSYNVTVICHTNDVKYDLSHSIKKSGEIVALYVNHLCFILLWYAMVIELSGAQFVLK